LAQDGGVSDRLKLRKAAYLREHGLAAYAEALRRLCPVPASNVKADDAHHG